VTSLSANHHHVPRRSAADTEGDVARVLAKLEATGQDLTILRLVANSGHAFRPFLLLSDALLNRAVLPAPVREVVILWMAVQRGVPYEWAEHVPMATRAGVTGAQVDHLAGGKPLGDGPFSDEMLLAVDIAADLLGRNGVSEEHWAAGVGRWGLEGMLDLVFTAGWWGGFVPTVLEALGLTEPDGS
jgi:hypothetical protein